MFQFILGFQELTADEHNFVAVYDFAVLVKLLRNHDIDAIMQPVNLVDSQTREYNDRFHALERWRNRLISDGDSALQSFVEDYPSTDIQHLRSLIRHAQHELKQNKAPTASRKIFRYLRDLDEQRLGLK